MKKMTYINGDRVTLKIKFQLACRVKRGGWYTL